MKMITQHAIVIGASMGGLLAARALTDYYQQVTVLERDVFPVPGENRKGVPQGRHAHGLLARGREVLEQLFPGFTQELEAQGALATDILQQLHWFANGGYLSKTKSELNGLFVSRPLLEAWIRQRLLLLPNVQALENCDVLGLVTTADPVQVTGVRFIQRNEGNTEEILKADLVVDTTGRNSRTPMWLEALGYEKPLEEKVKVNVCYTTRMYRRQPEHLQGDLGAVIEPSQPNWRGGVILAQENSHWIVSIAGYMGDHTPMDEQGFLEFAKSISAQDIYEVIKNAEPLSELLNYQFSSSQRRHYEQLKRFPEGYLVFGDAISSFNPIYGQGMTVAAVEALALQDCLGQGVDHLAPRFFKAASKIVDIPWSIAVGGDFRIPQVEGKPTPMVRFLNWYRCKLQIAARRDPVLAIAFLKVVNLMAAPSSLIQPQIALRVLLGNIFT